MSGGCRDAAHPLALPEGPASGGDPHADPRLRGLGPCKDFRSFAEVTDPLASKVVLWSPGRGELWRCGTAVRWGACRWVRGRWVIFSAAPHRAAERWAEAAFLTGTSHPLVVHANDPTCVASVSRCWMLMLYREERCASAVGRQRHEAATCRASDQEPLGKR